MSQEPQLPQQIRQRLKRLDFKVRMMALLRGCGILAVVIASGLGVCLAVDFWFDLSTGMRLLLSSGVIVSGFVTAFLSLLKPLFKKRTLEQLAALVEEQSPALHERLTSTIELTNNQATEGEKGSVLMREHLVRETVELVDKIHFPSAITPRKALKPAVIGLAAMLVLSLPFAISSSGYGLLWARLIRPWENTEAVSNLYFDIDGEERTISRGSDITFKVKPMWRLSKEPLPNKVWFNWKDDSNTTDKRQMTYDKEAGFYKTTLLHVFQPFDFYISSENARSKSSHINVVDTPEIISVSLEIEPPAYTGKKAELIDGVVGRIDIFEQSQLKLHLQFNKPIKTAQLKWIDDSEKTKKELPLQFSEDRTSASLEFSLGSHEGGVFEFRLKDKYQLTNSQEPYREFVVLTDQPPQLHIANFALSSFAQPTDLLRLKVAATDDVAVGALELHLEIQRASRNNNESKIILVPNDLLGLKDVPYEFRLNLNDYNLQIDDTIHYKFRAVDERPKPAPQEVWSESQQVSIREKTAPPGSQELVKRQKKQKQTLTNIRKKIAEKKEEAKRLERQARRERNSKQKKERDAQVNKMAAEIDQLSQQLEKLASEFAQSRLMEKLAKQTEEVARKELPQANKEFRKTSEQKPAKEAQSLSKGREQLEKAERKLDALDKEFEKLAEIERDLLELNRLAEEAKQLAKDAIESDKKRKEPHPSESAAQKKSREQKEQQEQKKMLAEQKQLSKKLDDLIERRPELLEAARQQQLKNLDQLAKKAKELAQQQEKLRDALQAERKASSKELSQLERKQNDILNKTKQLMRDQEKEKTTENQSEKPQEQPSQKEIEETRKLMQEALNNLRKEQLADAMQRQKEAASKLDQLAKGEKNQPENPLNKQAKELAKQQRELQKQLAQLLGKEEKKDAENANKQPSLKEVKEKQRQLAHRAMKQAIERANEDGLLSPEAKQSMKAAQQAAKASQEADAGNLKEAAKSASKSAQAGRKTGDEMQKRSDAQKHQKGEEAKQLASEQEENSQQLKRLAGSPSTRRKAQEEGQQDISRQGKQLANALSKASQELSSDPLNAKQEGKQAEAATQSAKNANASMQQSQENQQQGNSTKASKAASQAARKLREAAKNASRTSRINRQPPSPVPGDIGQQVVDAKRELDKAQKALDNQKNNPEKQPPSQQNEPGKKQANASEKSSSEKNQGDSKNSQQSKVGESQQGEKQGSKPGKTSQSSSKQGSPLSKSAQALQKAAQSLSNAAKQMQQGNSSSQKNQQQANKNSPSKSSSATGEGGSKQELDLAGLKKRLEQMESHRWGELSGKLQTEILQSSRKRPRSEYSKIIKYYFEEIARGKKRTSNSTKEESGQ